MTLFFLRHANERTFRFTKLDIIYGLFLITVILDSVWMLIDGIAEYRAWHIALQVVYLSSMAFTGYTWVLYIVDFFPAQNMFIKSHRYIIGIPVLIVIVLIISSIWTNWMFVVDENGRYIRGEYHIYTIIMNYSYLLLGSYVALRCRKEALLSMDKRRFTVAALFPVPILILSATQLILPPGLPAMQGGVLVALLLLYGTTQNVMITRDHLTGLPNRFAFEQDLLDRLRTFRNDGSTHLYLFEGDLDRFKYINDTYGHPAGDRALQLTAGVLTRVFVPYGAAVFRTGGDEFMMLTETEESLDIEAIRAELNEQLSSAESPDNIELSISLGAQEYDSTMDFRKLIESVDRQLYAAKPAGRATP